MYVLGIDGGGTKIEFMLADLRGHELMRFEFQENTNLKYVSPEKVISALQRGFDKISQDFDFSQIKSSYLGIAECGENCVGHGREKIVEYLNSKLSKFVLADDQYSVFRAKSPTPNGVLANAGTGSNINNFMDGQEINYKSVGIGGRDFGKMILAEIYYCGISNDSNIYNTVKDFLQQQPEEFYANLSPSELISDETVPKIPRELIAKSARDSDLRKELAVYKIITANRWSQKLSSFCSRYCLYKFDQSFDIILSGSLWRWEDMRNLMIEDFKRVFPDSIFYFDFDKKPVFGSVVLALEYLNEV